MVNNFCLLSPVKKQFLGQLGFCAILSGERDKMAGCNIAINPERLTKNGSVAKRCGHSLYTILNILAFDFSVLFVGYSLIGNISLTFFVAQRTKRPARGAFKSLLSLLVNCLKQYNSFDTRLSLQALLPFAGCCVIKCNLIDNACSN